MGLQFSHFIRNEKTLIKWVGGKQWLCLPLFVMRDHNPLRIFHYPTPVNTEFEGLSLRILLKEALTNYQEMHKIKSLENGLLTEPIRDDSAHSTQAMPACTRA